MESETQQSLNIGFDELLFQLSKGVTIEQYEKGMRWLGLEKVKEWKSRFGFQFHVYSNDHLIDNKPHFHLIKESDGIDCRFFFNATLIECKGTGSLPKNMQKELTYFLSKPGQQNKIIELWNFKNPSLKFHQII